MTALVAIIDGRTILVAASTPAEALAGAYGSKWEDVTLGELRERERDRDALETSGEEVL